MNLILFIALIVSISVLDWVKFTVLLIVIITNSSIGFFQEYRSEKTMDALRKMSSPTAHVLRDGHWTYVPGNEVVLGDIVGIKMGDVCPADLRLIESTSLETDDSFLTGEAEPIAKITDRIEPNGRDFIDVGDRVNCVFMNSTVVRGRGVGVAIGTGFASEVGKIAKLVSEGGRDEKTPLMKSLDRLMYSCAGTAIILGVIVFAADRFEWSTDKFLYAISVGIAILPEGLPAVITVSLSVSLRMMSKQNALVRKLAAVEAIGQVTDVCSDKTGTLTEGKMTLKEFWCDGVAYTVSGGSIDPVGEIKEYESGYSLQFEAIRTNFALDSLFKVAALCNTSALMVDPDTNRWIATGNPTEIALNVFASKAKFSKDYYAHLGLVLQQEFAFDSTVKRMAVVYKDTDGAYIYLAKGALERIIEISSSLCLEGKIEQLSRDKVDLLYKIMNEYAVKGMRVLLLAINAVSDHIQASSRQEVEKDMIIVGICAIYDPPRPESLSSVTECQRAGIKVHMASGDHPKTAEAIAREVGILSLSDASGPPLVLPAHIFDSLTEEEIDEMPELPRVLARCSPRSKVTLLEALHRRNRYVAMCGDGVNDSPAVKRADVGIAMGKSGSDVTKQASSITLTDDNFKTIVVAIREGRRLFSNIKSIVLNLLSGNASEVIVLVIGLSLRDTEGRAVFPMSAIQILWLNMITSSPIAIALGVEPATKDVMNQPPRKTQSLFDWELIIDILFYGIILGMLSLGSFILYIYFGPGLNNMSPGCAKTYIKGVCDSIYRARALSFITLSLLLLIHGFNCRHRRLSMFLPEKRNKPLVYAFLFGVVVAVPTLYIPYVNIRIFEHLGFGWIWWIVVICELLVFVGISEFYKFAKRWYFGRNADVSGNVPEVVVGSVANF